MDKDFESLNKIKEKINFIGFYNLTNTIKQQIISYDDNLLNNNFFKNENIIYLGINISNYTYLIPLENREYITKQGYKKGQTFLNLYKDFKYIITLRIALMFPVEKSNLNEVLDSFIFDYDTDYLKELFFINKDIIKEKISKIYLIGKDLLDTNIELKNIISNYNNLEKNIIYKENKKNNLTDKAKKIKGMIKTNLSNKIDYLHKKLRERKENKINKFKKGD